MNIEHLKEFVYLAETLSFTATARHFFLSPSVLSKHIASLEDDFQVKLFDRGNRTVLLTEDGEALYNDILAVVDRFDAAVANLRSRRANKEFRLRIGYLRGAARPFLPALVNHLEKSHPEIDLDIVCLEYGELIRQHRCHRMDIILNMDFDPEAVDACDSQVIYRDRLYAVVGRTHRLAARTEGIAIEELADEPLILPDEQAYPGLAQRYDAILGDLCRKDGAKRYKDIDSFYLTVAQGRCVGFSSGHNRAQFEGRAAFLPVVDRDTSYTVSAQWLKGADERIAAIGREISDVCAEFMRDWDDGLSF